MNAKAATLVRVIISNKGNIVHTMKQLVLQYGKNNACKSAERIKY